MLEKKACIVISSPELLKDSTSDNVSVNFIAASDLQTIEKLVDLCFRRDKNVINVKTNILIESIHDFVVPIDFQIEDFDGRHCGPNCQMKGDLPKFKFNQEVEN